LRHTLRVTDSLTLEGRTRGLAHWIVLALCFAAPLGLLVARVLLTPAPEGYGTHEQLGLPPCQSMDWFRIPCPGCGVTTSVAWFAHAGLWESLSTQPLGFALGAAALFAAPLAALAHVRGQDLGAEVRRWNRRETWFAFGAYALLAWIYKALVYWSS
jgi:hypothetical protein